MFHFFDDFVLQFPYWILPTESHILFKNPFWSIFCFYQSNWTPGSAGGSHEYSSVRPRPGQIAHSIRSGALKRAIPLRRANFAL